MSHTNLQMCESLTPTLATAALNLNSNKVIPTVNDPGHLSQWPLFKFIYFWFESKTPGGIMVAF